MSETFEYDNLIAGSQKAIVQRPASVAPYQSWSRGQVVARVTATGKWQVADEDATANYDDVGIAVEAVDSTDGSAINTTVYVEGEFNENELIVQYGDAVGDWREKLAGHGIYIRSARTTEGT
jgi:hypothetical protein